MSLILEALRKSEAERRRGEAPDLHAELAPLPAAAARPRLAARPAMFVVAALLLAAAAVAWWRPLPEVATAPAVATPGPSPFTGPASGAQELRGSGGVDLPHLPQVKRLRPPPVDRPALGSATVASAATDAGAGQNGTSARATASATAAPGMGSPATAPAGAEDTTAPAAGVGTAPPAATPALPAPLAGAAVEPAAPGAADLPKVSELDADARRQLPAMKLTLHMWNADPGRRFVILDGVRHVEGDRIGSGRISAIDSDGVVIDLGGRAVRLPLR